MVVRIDPTDENVARVSGEADDPNHQPFPICVDSERIVHIMPILHPPPLENPGGSELEPINLAPMVGVPSNAAPVIVAPPLSVPIQSVQDAAQDLTLPKKQPADSSSDYLDVRRSYEMEENIPTKTENNESEEEVIDVGRDDDAVLPSPNFIRYQPVLRSTKSPKSFKKIRVENDERNFTHFGGCASVSKEGDQCDCSKRYMVADQDMDDLYSNITDSKMEARDYIPTRVPWIPHYSLMTYKYQGLFRIQLDPNGGATSCHLYMDELVGMSSEEIKEVALEFISLSFSEDCDENAYHVIGVVHGGANYLPDLLDYFADHYGFITVNIGSLSGPESHANCLSQYRDRAYKTYSNGTFRFSPLQELSICGVKGEEYGAYFPDFVQRLESSPFMGPVLPWSKLSVVATDNPRDSNDGPIFWIRPGEQTIPLTERSKRRSANDLQTVRLTEDRLALFEDRTRPHADQIGVDGKGTRDNTAPTAAVGLLKAVNCGNPQHGGRATKDVVAFHAGDYARMQKIFSLDFYEPPLRQCHAWLDTARLNSLRRDGLRFARLQLHDGDVYYLPRKIVHQFQTISAVASVAWHIRFKKYFEEHGAPNLNTAKANKGAIYHEKSVVPPYVPPPPTDDEGDEGDPEDPVLEMSTPPRRRPKPKTPVKRTPVKRKVAKRISMDDSDDEDEDPTVVPGMDISEPGPSRKRRTKREKSTLSESKDGKRRGRKRKIPVIDEDDEDKSSPESTPLKEENHDMTNCRDKSDRPRDLKAIKREATEEFAAAERRNSDTSDVKPNINADDCPSTNDDAKQENDSKASEVKKEVEAVLAVIEDKVFGIQADVPNGNRTEDERLEGIAVKSEKKSDDSRSKRDKSHDDSRKKREHRGESSHSHHKSRSDKKHRSHDEKSKHSRKEGSSRSGHSSHKSSKTESSERDSKSKKDSHKSSSSDKKEEKSSKRRHSEAEDDGSKKRRHNSSDSHRSNDTKKESGSSSSKDDSKKGEVKKHDGHRHSSSSSSGHRHKSSDSRHSEKDRTSSHRHNGSHHESANASKVVIQSKPTTELEKPKPDSTTSGDPQPQKQPLRPDQSTSSVPTPNIAQLKATKPERKSVKRKPPPPTPPPPSGNVVGEIMAQMDKQRQM